MQEVLSQDWSKASWLCTPSGVFRVFLIFSVAKVRFWRILRSEFLSYLHLCLVRLCLWQLKNKMSEWYAQWNSWGDPRRTWRLVSVYPFHCKRDEGKFHQIQNPYRHARCMIRHQYWYCSRASWGLIDQDGSGKSRPLDLSGLLARSLVAKSRTLLHVFAGLDLSAR